MNKKRRFHLTEEQGQVVRLALASLIEQIQPIRHKEPTSPYWIWIERTAIDLQHKLETYNWIQED